MEWLALLGLIIGAVSVIESANATERTNDRNIKANKELQQLQNEFQKSETDRLNQYNLPVNQRQRLEDAGLNPMLAMQGMSALGTSTSVPSSHGVDLKAPDYSGLGDAFGSMNNTLLESQRVRNDAEYQTGMVESNIMNARANMINANTQAGRAIKQNAVDEKTKDLLEKEVQNYDADHRSIRDLNNSHANYFDQSSLNQLRQAGLAEAEANDLKNTLSARLENIVSSAYANWQEGAKDKSEAAFTDWWINPNNKDISSPKARELGADIAEKMSQELLAEEERLNIRQKSLNEQHNFNNFVWNVLSNALPAGVAALAYARYKQGSKLIGSTVYTQKGYTMSPQGRKVEHIRVDTRNKYE